MAPEVSIQVVRPRILAAVRREVRVGEVGLAWKPALDKVWEFLRSHPGLRTDGHNIFLYHHPERREAPMKVDFGVEVTHAFEQVGEVFCTETPAGRVASAVHIGPYNQVKEAHDAIHGWAATKKMTFAGKSWEIYGDPTDDPDTLETRIEYLLG